MNLKTETAVEKLGRPGRMISESKSGYREKNPSNLVVFNSNLCTRNEKIWFGDLDVTKEFTSLTSIAEKLNEEIYVLMEMDGRFENENSPRIDRAAITIFPNGGYSLRKSLETYDNFNLKPIK